jgi:hypothetical protein
MKHTSNQTRFLGKDKLQVEQDTDMRDRERTIREIDEQASLLAKVGSRPRVRSGKKACIFFSFSFTFFWKQFQLYVIRVWAK